MDLKKFESLSEKQKQAMLLGIEVRNKMEEFHVKYLSDEQMKELNPLIRQGIINGIELWGEYKRYRRSKKQNGEITLYMGIALSMIPDYWELPVENYYKKRISEKIDQE